MRRRKNDIKTRCLLAEFLFPSVRAKLTRGNASLNTRESSQLLDGCNTGCKLTYLHMDSLLWVIKGANVSVCVVG